MLLQSHSFAAYVHEAKYLQGNSRQTKIPAIKINRSVSLFVERESEEAEAEKKSKWRLC